MPEGEAGPDLQNRVAELEAAIAGLRGEIATACDPAVGDAPGTLDDKGIPLLAVIVAVAAIFALIAVVAAPMGGAP